MFEPFERSNKLHGFRLGASLGQLGAVCGGFHCLNFTIKRYL
eukprot:COSAG06_NODE_42718_length_379_cov_0.735714_1_plen_41_part_01